METTIVTAAGYQELGSTGGMFTAAATLLLIGVVRLADSATTTVLPLTKQGPFTINKLFDIVYKKYRSYMADDDDKKVVPLPPFKFHFVSKNVPVLNTTMEFDNGTFGDVARFQTTFNKTVYGVGNHKYMSETYIVCHEVFLFYYYQYQQTSSKFVRDAADIMIKKANVHVVMSYDLTPKNTSVELVKAYFCDLHNRRDIITGLGEYSHVEHEVADKIFDHFLTHHKRFVDEKLFEHFNTAINLSEIETVLNVTRM